MLDRPYSDEMLQRIVRENNLSETAYLRKTDESWHLRWFTLNGEIDLCGHATMAAAYAVMELIEPGETQVRFDTLSGRSDIFAYQASARSGVLSRTLWASAYSSAVRPRSSPSAQFSCLRTRSN